VDLSKLAILPLTYDDVGVTEGLETELYSLPEGYDHRHVAARVGSGRDRFEQAANALMGWAMQRGTRLPVQMSSDRVEKGAVLVTRIGPVRVPVRVIYVIDEPDRRGFAVGTLPGHPVSGEERFLVRYDPASTEVYAEVSAFSRPAKWWTKAGSPIAPVVHRYVLNRYVKSV
jgi:uncharacterized protein (UPF0548 family)